LIAYKDFLTVLKNADPTSHPEGNESGVREAAVAASSWETA
jgi:hypothetical protein